MTVADVKQIYESDIARICDTLKLPRELAVIAMRKYNWCDTTLFFYLIQAYPRSASRICVAVMVLACRDVHRFMDSWYEDSDKVRASIGMPTNDQLIATPNREVRAFIPLHSGFGTPACSAVERATPSLIVSACSERALYASEA